MVLINEIDSVIENIRNGIKYDYEEKFNYDLIPNSTSDSMKILLKKRRYHSVCK